MSQGTDVAEAPVVVITGAGSGIGRAAAQELANLGYRLVLVGRRREALEQTAAWLTTLDALLHPADVSDPAACADVVNAAVSAFGRLDALVNNAGVAPQLSIEQTADSQWRNILDTNLSAPFFLARAAWPIFRRQNAGVVVNLSSLAARDPFPQLSAYAAAKAGLNGLGLALAREGAPWNIRVHTLGLGAVETGMLRGIVSTEQLPADRTLSATDVARMIGRFVSGELAATNGEVVWLRQGSA